MDKDDKHIKNLSPEELKRIEDRFRERRDAKKSEETTAAPKQAQRRLFLRMAFWVILSAIVIGGLLLDDPKKVPVKKLPPSTPVTPLDGTARLPLGCKEVRDAMHPPLVGLADGSDEALQLQKKYSRKHGYPIEIENSVGIRFRLIPPGTFMMGSPEDELERSSDELQHLEVINNPFYIGKFEVTQAQYEKVMGHNPSRLKGPDRPVEEVSWLDAQAFCKKLNELENLPEGTYTLPLEKQWEYACRAGTQSAFYAEKGGEVGSFWGQKVIFYHELPAFAVYGHNSTGTEDVGKRRPNAWGLYNMHGNVWEWCQNKFYLYKINKFDHKRRSIRGGNWRVGAHRSRSAARNRLYDRSVGNLLGFRVIRLITPKTITPATGEKSEEMQKESAEEKGETPEADVEKENSGNENATDKPAEE